MEHYSATGNYSSPHYGLYQGPIKERVTYKVNKVALGILLALGVVPGLIYLGVIGLLNYLGERKVTRQQKDFFIVDSQFEIRRTSSPLEGSGSDLLEDIARSDESMVVRPALYDKQVHGVNGFRMKQKLFTSLLDEYALLLKEKLGVDPMTKLQQIEATPHYCRSREEHLLMYVLHYLLHPNSQEYHVTVSGEEARYRDFIQAHRKLMENYQGNEETYNQDVLLWSRTLAEVRMYSVI